MKFRSLLILAFSITAIVLVLDSNSLLMFSADKEVKSKKISESVISNQNLTFTDVANYSNSIASEISRTRLTNIIANAIPKNSCVQAIEIDDNKYLSEPFLNINSENKLIPASTNKLITASVVLSTFDPNSTLDTKIIASKISSTITNAYVRSVGDPSFVSTMTPPVRRPDFLSPKNVRTFDSFAQSVYKAGVRKISNLIVDAKWFKLSAIEPGWADDKNQVGQISAFNIDEGFAGDQLAPDPTVNAANALQASLIAKGVVVEKVSFQETPKSIKDSGVVVATSSSPSIKTLVSDMLKTSDNVYAEELLASAAYSKYGFVDEKNRKEYVIETLRKLGIDTSNYEFINASGYSTKSKLTCDFENKVKQAMFSLGIDLSNLSSIAATDGTLQKRFIELKGKLVAKTGTLDNVTALSGKLNNKIVFTFISNSAFSDEQGRKYQENVIDNLNQYPFIKKITFSQ